MSQLKAYPEYKDSGVEWIGEIPKEWEVIKLKNIGHFSSSGINKKIEESLNLVKIINYTDVYGNKSLILKNRDDYMKVTATEKQIENHTLKEGDLIFTPSSETIDDIGVSSLVYEDLDNTCFSYHVLRFQFSKEVDKEYKKYLCNNNYVLNKFSSLATGSIRKTLNRNDFKNTEVILPTLQDQKKISRFLDEKNKNINSLIKNKERLIELLEEKRQAVITETVTKGLDPDVKMKDSGIEWIGDIPEHWNAVKIKFLTNHNLIYGANESAELDDRKLPRYIRITDINKEGYLNESTYRSLPFDIALKYPVIKDDILFARTGATVGKTYIHQENKTATYAGYLIKFRSDNKKLNAKYLYYFTLSPSYEEWIQANLIQATIENVSAEKYRNMEIPYPPLKNQNKIVEYLENYIKNNESLIKKNKKQISKLKEYRESLIYEAVTGKIDVREI